jgi:hypothetical protein
VNKNITKTKFTRLNLGLLNPSAGYQRTQSEMVKSTIYKGIEFVTVSSLSEEEQELFRRTFKRSLLIKIMIDKAIVHDCIQYRDYVLWHAIYIEQNASIKQMINEGSLESLEEAPQEEALESLPA